MIEKLETNGRRYDEYYDMFDKINELCDHLNTQEEKEKQLGVAEPCIVPTASNQSNTDGPALFSMKHPTGKKIDMNDISVEEGTYGRLESGGCVRYQRNDEGELEWMPAFSEGALEQVDVADNTELPQKIKLLKDRAGYLKGEYVLKEGDMFSGCTHFYHRILCGYIHPDIIKATSGQGIRSEVTDGEELLDRSIETNKEVEPTTESVSRPIENIDRNAIDYIMEEEGDFILHHGCSQEFRSISEYIQHKCFNKHSTKPFIEVTPDPYEECVISKIINYFKQEIKHCKSIKSEHGRDDIAEQFAKDCEMYIKGLEYYKRFGNMREQQNISPLPPTK